LKLLLYFIQNVDIAATKRCSLGKSFTLTMTDLIPNDGVIRFDGMWMWQVNDDGLSSLLDVAELLGVRGLKSDRRPEPAKAGKPHDVSHHLIYFPN
jgi:hypothetical protein